MPGANPSKRISYFPDRIKRLRRLMKAEALDAFLVTHLANVRYLTGFTGSSGCLLVQPQRTIFISDNRYREQATREVVCDEMAYERLSAGRPQTGFFPAYRAT